MWFILIFHDIYKGASWTRQFMWPWNFVYSPFYNNWWWVLTIMLSCHLFSGSKILNLLNCYSWGAAGMVNFNIFCRLVYHLRAYPFDIVPHVICPNGNFTNELCRPVPNTPKNVKNTVRPVPDSTLVSCIKIVAENVFMSSTLGFIVGRGGLLPFFLLIMFFHFLLRWMHFVTSSYFLVIVYVILGGKIEDF